MDKTLIITGKRRKHKTENGKTQLHKLHNASERVLRMARMTVSKMTYFVSSGT